MTLRLSLYILKISLFNLRRGDLSFLFIRDLRVASIQRTIIEGLVEDQRHQLNLRHHDSAILLESATKIQ